MQAMLKVSLLAAAVALAAGCDQPTIEGTTTTKPAAEVSEKAQAGQAFTRNGEFLTINVKDMERSQFTQELQKLTGARIDLRVSAEGKVSVNADKASLRAVLAQAFNEAPYAINMQFNNAQDSFPSQVLITAHGTPAPVVNSPLNKLQQGKPEAAAAVDASDADDVDFDELTSLDEKMAYFYKQDLDEQSSIVFELDADEDRDVLHALFNDPRTPRGIKVEILDNFSFGEYDSAINTINAGLTSDEPAVIAKAITVLGELGSEDDLETVKHFTSGDYPISIREAAEEAVEFLEP